MEEQNLSPKNPPAAGENRTGASGEKSGERSNSRRRRPNKRRGESYTPAAHSGEKPSSGKEQSPSPEGNASARPEGQAAKSNKPSRPENRSRQNRSQDFCRENRRQDTRENREDREGKETARGYAFQEEASRTYEPDWGTPPDPADVLPSLRNKPVDQPLSGRSFSRRG